MPCSRNVPPQPHGQGQCFGCKFFSFGSSGTPLPLLILIIPIVLSSFNCSRPALLSDTAVCLSHYLFYALKALLNMHPKSEERRKRLQELCRQWHIPYTAGHAGAGDAQSNSNTYFPFPGRKRAPLGLVNPPGLQANLAN